MHVSILTLLIFACSLFGSAYDDGHIEQYDEPKIVTQVNSIPLWKGTKDDRALTSKV